MPGKVKRHPPTDPRAWLAAQREAQVAFLRDEIRRLGLIVMALVAVVSVAEHQPARLAEYDNTALLHQKHVSDHKVDCLTCHLQIEHGRGLPPGAGTTAAGENTSAR